MSKNHVLAVFGAAVSIGAPAWAGLIANNGSTNNVTDFVHPATGTNVTDGGRWSYLIGGTSDLTPTNGNGLWNAGLLNANGTGPGGNPNFSNTWNVGYNQYTRLIGEEQNGDGDRVVTDYRPLIYNYTIDANEGGQVEIKGSLYVSGGSRSYNLFVLQSTDTSATSLAAFNDTDHQKTLFSSIATLGSDGSVPFDIITTVAPGNDILLAYSTNGSNDYLAFRELNATISSVPEPASAALVGVAGLIGLRRRRANGAAKIAK